MTQKALARYLENVAAAAPHCSATYVEKYKYRIFREHDGDPVFDIGEKVWVCARDAGHDGDHKSFPSEGSGMFTIWHEAIR